MTEPQVDVSPTPKGEAVPDRRQAPRSVVPPPDHRTGAVFPHPPDRRGRAPAEIRGLLWEAVRRPRNLVPFALIMVLAIVGVGLLAATLMRRAAPPPNEFLARLVVSSSRPGTSLFGNDRYLGEIGPRARAFMVVPGQMRLRLVRSHCRARDTTFQLEIGAQRTIGPLDPVCGPP